MTLDSAAQDLCSDLNMLQARMLMEGWPVRARILNCGTTGAPGRGPTGIFSRFDCNGEQYVFTVTGPARSLEAYLGSAHENLQRLLARHWPAREAVESDLRGLMQQWQQGEAQTTAGYDEQEIDPRRRRRHERGIMHQHTFSVQRRPDGVWTACVCIPTTQGPIHLCATADEHAIAQALHSELSEATSGRDWTRSEHFRSACGAVAEDRVLDRLGAAMRSMVRDPGVQSVFSSIVPFVPVVGPPAALAFEGAKMAMSINDKLQQGDPGTTAKVRQVAQQAKAGDPKAKIAIKALMFARDAAKDQALKTKDERILKLEAENKELQMKLATCEKKWKESPLDAADDFVDMFGGGDDYVGPDMVKAAGVVMGKQVEEASGNPILARPLVASYYTERLPEGDRQKRNGSPEVGALYHRPMREASSASLRQAYLRGDALERTDFRTDQHPGTRELIPGWGRTAAPRH